MMRWLIILIVFSFSSKAQVSDDQIVHVNVGETVLKSGRKSTITVWVKVKDGYHIQANKVDDQYIVPTILDIAAKDGFSIRDPIFPSTKKFKLEGTDSALDVYDGKFEIKTDFKTAKQVATGVYILNAKLNYQACDSVRCLSPRTMEFLVNVQVQY